MFKSFASRRDVQRNSTRRGAMIEALPSRLLMSAHGKFGEPEGVVIRSTLIGDTNLDGSVNLGDFSSLTANFNSPSQWDSGDVNHDGEVNLSDFSSLTANFNQTIPGSTTLPGSVVGEPTTTTTTTTATISPRANWPHAHSYDATVASLTIASPGIQTIEGHEVFRRDSLEDFARFTAMYDKIQSRPQAELGVRFFSQREGAIEVEHAERFDHMADGSVNIKFDVPGWARVQPGLGSSGEHLGDDGVVVARYG